MFAGLFNGQVCSLRGNLQNGTLCTPTGLGGVSSAVERELPKLDVTGSIPVPRSKFIRTVLIYFESVEIFSFASGRANALVGLCVLIARTLR
jgi:hypothetical protein